LTLAVALPAVLAKRDASHALVQLQLARGTTSATYANETPSSVEAGTSLSGETVIDKIVFIKLHSVGSSTMTSILHHYCELHHKNCFVYPRNVRVGLTLDPHVLGQIVSEFTSGHMPALDIWPNHAVMDPSLFDALIPGNFKTSFFRLPLDRLVSSFRHGAGAGSVLKVMERLKQNFGVKTCGPASMSMAKQITAQQVDELDLVMLTEQYDLSLMMLRRALGWSMFDMMYRRMKRHIADKLVEATFSLAEYLSKPSSELNTATRRYLEACVGPDDTAVYLHASNKFQQQWENLGPEGQRTILDELAKFQSARNVLVECCESKPLDSYCEALGEDNAAWNHRYQKLGLAYTSMQPNRPAQAAITYGSPCKTLVQSLLVT